MKLLLVYIFFFSLFLEKGNADFSVIPQKPEIISRASWGANEQYTSKDSPYWQSILESWKNYKAPYVDPAVQKKREENSRKSISYINENFSKENTIVEKIPLDPTENFTLAWPLQYTDYVNAIVVHHTHSEYQDDTTGMEQIYKYHSISRAWGDIGYHYIIGYNGEIYEGKKGGDYVVGAHSKWNNNSTVSIALMGDYMSEGINDAQYESLNKMVRYLSWKYGIDLNKKYYYHMDCAGKACNTFPLETYLDSTLVGHRDTGHTSCPGDKLYAQIQEIREKNLEFSKGFQPIKRGENPEEIYKQQNSNFDTKLFLSIREKLKKLSQEELFIISGKLNTYLGKKDITEAEKRQLKLLEMGIKSISE